MRTPLLALLLGAAAPLAAQFKPIAPAPSRLFVVGSGTVSAGPTTDTLPTAKSNGVGGAVIGGLSGGAIGFIVAREAFSDDDDVTYLASSNGSGQDDGEVLVTSLVTLGSAAVGAWIGHRIATAPPSQGVGDHRVTGAMMGGVLGGALGYVASLSGGATCTTSYPAECFGDDGPSSALTTIGGAAIGAGLGYLMGRSTPKAGAR